MALAFEDEKEKEGDGMADPEVTEETLEEEEEEEVEEMEFGE